LGSSAARAAIGIDVSINASKATVMILLMFFSWFPVLLIN